jgi:hypothetical protein
MLEEVDMEEQLIFARKAIRESLEIARGQQYTTKGRAWRQIIASLAFETPADLSLIQYFDDEQEQARFQTITQAFMDGILPIGDVIDLYLEFFPRPKEWKDFDGLLGGADQD